jgi:cyclophilin family peptidyl-prolyl cis-trans isomerase
MEENISSMKKLLLNCFFASFCLALASCGGGATSDPYQPDIQASGLNYGSKATFFVGVTTLNPGTSFSATNCTTLQSAPSTTANYVSYTCSVTGTGPVVFSGTDASGKVIATQSFKVPNPQVAIYATIGTTSANFVVELNQPKAPVSTDNFLRYVKDGFYTGTLFHRVIPNFVVQAGGFTTGLTPKTSTYDPIALESQNGLSNIKGSLAMARTSDPNSATSQFYINLKDNTNLDYVDANSPGYAVFGSVIAGQSAIDNIAAGTTGTASGLTDVPITEIRIINAIRIQ